MIRPGPEKHGVWPNLSLDNALLILGRRCCFQANEKEASACADASKSDTLFCPISQVRLINPQSPRKRKPTI